MNRKHGAHTWLEDGSNSNGTTYTLREKNLVVLVRDRGHHKTKDVHEGAH
jgi:hypothetical protein